MIDIRLITSPRLNPLCHSRTPLVPGGADNDFVNYYNYLLIIFYN